MIDLARISHCHEAGSSDSYPRIVRDGQYPRRILRGGKRRIGGAQAGHARDALPAGPGGRGMRARRRGKRAVDGLKIGGRIGAGESWRGGGAIGQIEGGGGRGYG